MMKQNNENAAKGVEMRISKPTEEQIEYARMLNYAKDAVSRHCFRTSCSKCPFASNAYLCGNLFVVQYLQSKGVIKSGK